MMWTTAFADVVHWRRRRKAVQRWADELVSEAEAFLAGEELPRRPLDDPPTWG